MPGRDTAPGFLLQQPSRGCAAILAKRTQVAKAQHWMERGCDPGHSGETRREGRPPFCAPVAPAAERQDRLRRSMIPTIRAGNVGSRYLCCTAVRNAPFALSLPPDPPFGVPRHASDRQSRVQRLGPSLLRFRDCLPSGRGQGRAGRTQRGGEIHPVQIDLGAAHARRGRNKSAESRQDCVGGSRASRHAGHAAGHGSGRRHGAGTG